MACIIEIWTMVGEQQTLYTPACLTCGWIGSDGTLLVRMLAEAFGGRGLNLVDPLVEL